MSSEILFGREVCGRYDIASQREWLVTNGIGGFASGTVGDVLTRRYHGVLVAALQPPVGRTMLLAKLEATASYDDRVYALGSNRWADGTIDPRGYREIERFELIGSVPSWTYAFSDVVLQRTIWMEHGANTTYVSYKLVYASGPVHLNLRALVDARDYHSLTHAYDVHAPVAIEGSTARVQLNSQAPVLYLSCGTAQFQPGTGWYNGFRLDAETERGLNDLEDLYQAVTIDATLSPGESITVVASAQADSATQTEGAFERRARADSVLLSDWRAVHPTTQAPAWIERLVLAADQFIVARAVSDTPGSTVIAGYPWFGDWGRDTMIALPGLTLVAGRRDVARDILLTFSKFLDRGMLPNRFPDAGQAPEYNTVDATLWYVEAIAQYVEASGDRDIELQLFSALEDIVKWHVQGTRYNIHVDESDGLLYAGQDGVQLTWMDAKVGDHVITPRTGKAIEINALWYNALRVIENMARRLNRPAESYAQLADRTRASFDRFWNPGRSYAFDVIDGPSGNDPSIRPNAVIAASLKQTPLLPQRCKAIVDVAARELLTTYGLRTLSPEDPQYQGRYGGNQAQRDGAYHQGTVWPWLLGPFVTAHLSVYGNLDRARSFLAGIDRFLTAYGVGSIAEIAEGDAPYEPRGCTAQAWSVGEILRAWHVIELKDSAGSKST